MEQHEQRARFNLVGHSDAAECLHEGGQVAGELRADAAVGKEGSLAGDLFADNAVEEVDDGAAVEFGAGLVRIVQNIFLFFQKS